jgi:hypothetical protein
VINYVTANNIHDMIDGKNTDWIVKQDIPDYDHTRQCVKFAQKEIVRPSFLFSSVFSGALENASPPQGRIADSLKQTLPVTIARPIPRQQLQQN